MQRIEDRFRRPRAEEALKPLEVTPFVIKVLTLLARYRYLRSSFIYAFWPERNQYNLSEKLKQLFRHGYIGRPKTQRNKSNTRRSPLVYELDTKGEELLLSRGISPFQVTRLYREKTDGPVKNFAHAMMICDALASIELGARKAGLEFITWSEVVARTSHPKPLRLPYTIRHVFEDGHSESKASTLVPDALFGIRYPDGRVNFFGIECEHYTPVTRTSLEESSFLRKFLGYRDINRSKVYKDQLNIPNLRVIVLSPNQQHVNSQIALVEKMVGKSALFLFRQVPVQEEIYKAPPPYPSLLTGVFLQAGSDPCFIDRV